MSRFGFRKHTPSLPNKSCRGMQIVSQFLVFTKSFLSQITTIKIQINKPIDVTL